MTPVRRPESPRRLGVAIRATPRPLWSRMLPPRRLGVAIRTTLRLLRSRILPARYVYPRLLDEKTHPVPFQFTQQPLQHG
jgi:hypothetical protein